MLQVTNYKTTILKLFVLSVALARTATILPVVSEITRLKTYNIRIKSEMCKWSITNNKTNINRYRIVKR